MVGWGLITAAALMGLAGTPHCAAMCSAPCAAVLRGCGGTRATPWGFHLGRVAGYAAAGALAASSIGLLRDLLSWAPWLRPLWTLLHLAALGLGLWMLASGRMPAWRVRSAAAPQAPLPGGWQRVKGPARAGLAGAAWIAWPCGLSQSALLLAALADRPETGAAAMAVFALASTPGLLAFALLPALRGLSGKAGAQAVAATWPIRLAGGALVLGSAWAVGHGLWQRVADWCVS